MLQKFPLDKIYGTKNALIFVSRDPTHRSFTFNLRAFCELEQKVCLSKTVCIMFSIIDSVLFLLKFTFLFSKKHKIFDFKTS